MLSPSALTRSGPSTIPTAMVTSTRTRPSSSSATPWATCPMAPASTMKTSTSASVSSTKTARARSKRARWSSSLSRSLACEHVHHDRDSADPECARVSTCNTHAKFKDVYKEMELGVCAPATDFGVCQLSTSPTSWRIDDTPFAFKVSYYSTQTKNSIFPFAIYLY